MELLQANASKCMQAASARQSLGEERVKESLVRITSPFKMKKIKILVVLNEAKVAAVQSTDQTKRV